MERREFLKGALRFSPLLIPVVAETVIAAACGSQKPEKPRALIIDELSITDPVSSSMNQAATTLVQNGYNLAYIPPQNVYVSEFQKLPKFKADIIIIRSHSYDVTTNGNAIVGNDVGLFTSQPYVRDLFMDEQRRGDISPAYFLDRKQNIYFGIGPKFVENDMDGKFKQGTTVIVMGCNSLSNESLAKALFNKGVETYVGWKGSVTAEHTDKATEVLINHLVADHMTPQEAARVTNSEVGPDPYYGGSLQVLQNSQSNSQK